MAPEQVRYWTLAMLWSIGMQTTMWSVIAFVVARKRGDRTRAFLVFGLGFIWLWCCLAASPEVQDIINLHLPR